ncbi:MAG: CBS domain-containing protein [Thermacetogeniaceae bacterium]
MYSKNALYAFLTLLATYALMVIILSLLQFYHILTFQTNITNDLLPLITSLPFVALYLVIFLAATAGYARAAVMANELPFNVLLKNELKERSMACATIKAKIRSGVQINNDTSLLDAVNTIITSRIPILAVIDKDSNKVTGVITSQDLLQGLRDEFKIVRDALKNDPGQVSIKDVLATIDNMNINKLISPPTTVNTGNDLQNVLDTMIKNQFTKLIVIDEDTKTFSGTIDVLDLVTEIVGC